MIHVEGLCFRAGAFELHDLSLQVEEGEYFVLLGPTGSGKTVLLECLCGLNALTSGVVEIGGRDVTDLPPRERGIGYLPQDYALFPHLTVLENVRFGLRHRAGGPAEGMQTRAEALLEQMSIGHLADRYPLKLSGGEKQRTALARALAIGPRALLLDEPVSALDEATRDRVCRDLRTFQKSSRTTTLHVCHNFAEMLAVADRVAIVDEGRIVQVGRPREILDRPATERIARFVQSGNILTAQARDAGGGQSTLEVGASATFFVSGEYRGAVRFTVRPEHLYPVDEAVPTAEGSARVAATVAEVVDLGACVRVSLTLEGGGELQMALDIQRCAAAKFAPGRSVTVSCRAENVHVLG